MLKRATLLLCSAALPGALSAQSGNGGQPAPIPAAPAGYDADLWRRAVELHREAVVMDTHSDTTSRILDEDFDMGPRAADGHMDLPRIAEGGLDGQFYSIYVAATYYGNESGLFGWGPDVEPSPNGSARRALDMMDGLLRTIERYPDRMRLCTSVADVRRAVADGVHAALMGIEGGHAIEGDLGLLRMFHHAGIRYMTLTHTNHNHFADSCAEAAPRWGGLNKLGVKVVQEMNRLGMLIDASHVSDATYWDVLRVTRAPVILSHSSVRALCQTPRNVTDEMLKALAKNGGVIMINYNCGFVDEEYQKLSGVTRGRRAMLEREARRKFAEGTEELRTALTNLRTRFPDPPRPKLDALMAHFFHAIEVAGIDHVGLGSDFDGVPCVPEGMDDVTHLPRITYHLLDHGIDAEGVKKVLGENLLRVFAAAERTAKSLAGESPRRNDPATDFERLER